MATQTQVATGQLRAVGYLRVSTAHQATERNVSLDTQEERFREYCQRHGLVPVTTFTDVASGRRDDREEYRRLVDFALGGGTDVVVVMYLDRFGRNPREILRRYWELEEHGVQVQAIEEDLREEIVLLVKAGVAGAESRRNRERVRANMTKAIARGVHAGRAPYGYRRVVTVEDGRTVTKWEQDPIEAVVVREMWRLATEENTGYKRIAEQLAVAGYRTRGGGPFAAFGVHKILTNPALKGDLVWGRSPRKGNERAEAVVVPGFFPAVLNEAEWAQLQGRLSIRRENPRGSAHVSTYLLSGIARCGHCGGPMVAKSGRKSSATGERYRSYRCSRAKESRYLCGFANYHSALKLERAVLSFLAEYADPRAVREKLAAARPAELRRLEKDLAAVGRELADLDAKMLKDLERLDSGDYTSEEWRKISATRRERQAALRARDAELADRLEATRRQADLAEKVPQAVKGFLEAFESLEVRRAKALLQTILKAAHVYRDGRIELEFRDG